MNHRGTETQRINQVTEKVIGACIEVHREIGPGLLESAYEECLSYELEKVKLKYARQVELPILYKGNKLAQSYRVDLIVERLVVVELKSVDKILPVHQAQLITYLKMLDMPLGLLINFNVPVMKQGIKRVVSPNYKL